MTAPTFCLAKGGTTFGHARDEVLQMLDPKFVSVKTKAPGRLHRLVDLNKDTRAAYGEVLEDRTLARTPLSKVETSMLFTYMHRRFGLGNVGGDDYKDLGAGWLITTPRDDLFLLVTPSFSGTYFSFNPYVLDKDGGQNLRDTVRGDLLASMLDAYERTLLDLLRPVCQRDHDFNVLGEIDEEDNCTPEWAETDDDDEYESLPSYHPSCGTSMPDGLFGGKDWQRLLGILRLQGDGDIPNGLRNMVAAAEESALQSVLGADRELYPIIAAGLRLADYEWAQQVLPSLDLDETEQGRVTEFIQIGYGNGLMNQPSPWALSLTEEQVRTSIGLVAAFGVPTFHMDYAMKNIVRAQRFTREWERFASLCGGDFDLDHIPDDMFPTEATAEGFRRNVASAGLDTIAAWAEQLSSTEDGRAALWTVVAQLWNMKKSLEEENNRSATAGNHRVHRTL